MRTRIPKNVGFSSRLRCFPTMKSFSEQTDAANECDMIYSNIVTDRFPSTNIEAQNYVFNKLSEINDMQQKKGVTSA